MLDRADLLDNDNRAGLVRGLERVVGKTGMAVLLCRTGVMDEYGPSPWGQVALAAGETSVGG